MNRIIRFIVLFTFAYVLPVSALDYSRLVNITIEDPSQHAVQVRSADRLGRITLNGKQYVDDAITNKWFVLQNPSNDISFVIPFDAWSGHDIAIKSINKVGLDLQNIENNNTEVTGTPPVLDQIRLQDRKNNGTPSILIERVLTNAAGASPSSENYSKMGSFCDEGECESMCHCESKSQEAVVTVSITVKKDGTIQWNNARTNEFGRSDGADCIDGKTKNACTRWYS